MDKLDTLLATQGVTLTAEQYVEDVLTGRQLACKWVRLACERHRRLMAEREELGIYFDQDAAKRVIAFFSTLRHSKGEWAGRPLRLEPWQQFIIWMVFGWKRDDHPNWVMEMPDGRVEDSAHTRLFRTMYLEVARKNGKSTLGAGLGLYLLLGDGEPGAEIYTAATKRDQARITHQEATRMAKGSSPVRKRVKTVRDNIYIENTASKFEPLGADADTMDGLHVHGAIVDELHAHKTRRVWDALDTATGSRRQSLLVAITTAGYDRESLCWKEHEYTQKVLANENEIEDLTYFGIIYALDDGDDWEDEQVWIKSNPNLGVSKKWFDMKKKAQKAKEIPSALNVFKRKELNLWTQAITKWVPREHWNQCGSMVDAEGLRGRTCYAGLDLSSNSDISAFVMVFPPQDEDDKYQIVCRFYIPEEAMVARSRKDRVHYDAWVRQGYITATPGNVIDYAWIMHQIDEDAQGYDIREIAFDRWGATKIATELMDRGGEDWLVQFGQGYRSMSPPMKELERLILEHKLAHGNHPVLNWMADNLVVRMDPAGNLKPDKEKSTEKIDGMVALIMALDRALRHEPPKRSVYEDRGLETV